MDAVAAGFADHEGLASPPRHDLHPFGLVWLSGLAVLGGVSLLIFLPELLPFLQGMSQGWRTGTPISASDDFAPDLLGTRIDPCAPHAADCFG